MLTRVSKVRVGNPTHREMEKLCYVAKDAKVRPTDASSVRSSRIQVSRQSRVRYETGLGIWLLCNIPEGSEWESQSHSVTRRVSALE